MRRRARRVLVGVEPYARKRVGAAQVELYPLLWEAARHPGRRGAAVYRVGRAVPEVSAGGCGRGRRDLDTDDHAHVVNEGRVVATGRVAPDELQRVRARGRREALCGQCDVA